MPLTPPPQNQLIFGQLSIDPDEWEYTKEGLIALIETNAALSYSFQLNRAKLDALDGQISRGWLPSLAELEQELFPETKEVASRFIRWTWMQLRQK